MVGILSFDHLSNDAKKKTSSSSKHRSKCKQNKFTEQHQKNIYSIEPVNASNGYISKLNSKSVSDRM